MENWLKSEIVGTKKIFLSILFFTIFALLLNTGVFIFLELIGFPMTPSIGTGIRREILTYGWLSLPVSLLMWALLEESIFRFPITLLAWFKLKYKYILYFVLIYSSFIFGIAHDGKFAFLIQGSGGLLLSIVYMKFGGLKGKLFKPLFAATLVHMGYNLIFTIFHA